MKPEPQTGPAGTVACAGVLDRRRATVVDSYRPCSVTWRRYALTGARPRAGGKADAMSLVHAVEVPRLPVSRLEPVIGAPRYAELVGAVDRFRPVLAGRTIWNVNSTAAGGGVAEMLQVLVGYVQDLDIAIGWLVITGDAEFFAITKRLHNQIHGSPSGAPLGAAEAGHYAQMPGRERGGAGCPDPARRCGAAA